MTQIPKSSTHSEVWSTGYILKATNVKPKNSGNYCCLVGEMEACTENATTQLVVAGDIDSFATGFNRLLYIII